MTAARFLLALSHLSLVAMHSISSLSKTPLLASALPPIIQGGMGVGVSGWHLAKAVSQTGQLGVVSGTAIDSVIVRKLQLGDPDGEIRRTLATFPFPEIAARILQRYWRPEGKADHEAFVAQPMVSHRPGRSTQELMVASAFVAIRLAKEGHDGVIGINLLEKIQTPTLFVLYGAMLADVDVVLMGAGIPRQIPGILDKYAENLEADMRLDVAGATEPVKMHFDPNKFSDAPPTVKRPIFLAIVASPVLAENLRRKASGRVDGFVVEAPTAGGHNAPPRGPMQLNEKLEPIYGPRDKVDPAKFCEIGLPFWLAGGFGRKGGVKHAQALGAKGVQVGTTFALSDESGFAPKVKAEMLEKVLNGTLEVQTSATASPTGFPFKMAKHDGTLSDDVLYQNRQRICDLGVLREPFQRPDGSIGFRCPSEPVDDFIKKGGTEEQTQKRVCLCNSLLASVGLGQVRDGEAELPFLTLGDDLEGVKSLLGETGTHYSAAKVVEYLLA